MPWLIALLLGNPCEHIYILDNWETQFIVTWQLRVTLGSIQYSCNVLDQFSFWSSFSHLLLILSHICQSTVGSRMSWSNIFDFLWMSKQVGRVGPCFFPGGPKSWVRGQSRFIHFTFSPAGWERGLCSSCRGGLVSWPQVPQEPSSACTFLQLCQHLCPHLLQTSARESLVWKLLEWFTNLWLYFNRCLAHHFLAKFGSHEMKIAKEHDCGQPGSFPCYILPSLFNLSKHMIDKVIIKVLRWFGCCADLLIIFISRLAKRFFWSWALCPKTTTMVSRRSWSSGSYPSWAFREAEKW